MKTFNNFLKGSGLLVNILFVALLVNNGCTKQGIMPEILDENLNEMNIKSMSVFQGEVCLEGTSNFDVYSPKEDRVVVSPDEMFLIMEAQLTHVGGHNYLLKTSEYMPLAEGPMLYRIFEFDVKISEGGVVMFSYPETWWELGEYQDDLLGQILAHTGCIASGPGVNKGTFNWKGTFDGENFIASTHFIAKQVQDPVMPVYIGLDGPIKFEFSMTLKVVDCSEIK